MAGNASLRIAHRSHCLAISRRWRSRFHRVILADPTRRGPAPACMGVMFLIQVLDAVDCLRESRQTALSAKRRKEADVERISALIADLDFSPGKCGDIDTANAIIDDLSKNPWWSTGGDYPQRRSLASLLGDHNGYSVVYGLAALLKRWRRLVIAETHGAHADNVSIWRGYYGCREPSTTNPPQPARADPCGLLPGFGCGAHAGRRGQAVARLRNPRGSGFPEETEFKSDPSTWEFADETCSYAAAMIDGWAEDAQPNGLELGKARHHWFLSLAVRIGCARRLNVSPKTITNTPKSF